MNPRHHTAAVVLAVAVAALVLATGAATAQNAGDGGYNVSDLEGELREQIDDENQIRRTLDTDTYLRSVEWDGGNDTAYLTVVSSNDEEITVTDAVTYDQQKQADRQDFTVSGTKTLKVDSWKRGRQVLDVSTEDTITRVASSSSPDLLQKVYWFVPAVIFAVFVAYFTLRGKRKEDRQRGTQVWDRKEERYIEVVHRSIEVDTSSYLGVLKYHVLRLKESVMDFYYGGTVRGVVLLLLGAWLVDFFAFNQLLWYSLSSSDRATLFALISVPIGVSAAYTASWILSLFPRDYEHDLLVLDEGELSGDELPEYDDVQSFIENYQGRDDAGYRFLAMDDEVFSRFERVLEDDLTEKPYADGDEIKIARMVDLERNKILPDPSILHDSGEIRANEDLIERNHQILVRFKEAFNILRGAAPLIEDYAREQAHASVAEKWAKALSSSDEDDVASVLDELTRVSDHAGNRDVDAGGRLEGILDKFDPRTSKGDVRRGGEDGDD